MVDSLLLLQDLKKMNSDTLQLIFVWFIGVVAFFVLWAVLTKVIKRIGEKKSQEKDAVQEEFADKEILPKQPS